MNGIGWDKIALGGLRPKASRVPMAVPAMQLMLRIASAPVCRRDLRRLHAHLYDRVGLARDGAIVVLAPFLDRIDVLHAADHLAPHGVLTIEPRRIAKADEELAIGAVGTCGARHRAGAANVIFSRKFRLEVGKLRAARPGPRGIAGLCHEARYDAMEDDAIVEAAGRKLLDARNMARCKVRTQRDRDRARLQF